MKKPKPSTAQLDWSAGTKKPANLEDIFHDCPSLGWQVLDTQSKIYTQIQINMQKITHLTELYMRVIQKLNTLQDQRQHYFTFKMHKLMSEPYIIRLFNNQNDHKKNNLDDRRKKLEQKIQKQAERQNHKVVVQEALKTQEEKEKKMIKKIKDFIDESEKNVQLRIKRRNQIRQLKNSVLSPQNSINIQQTQLKTTSEIIDKTKQSQTCTSRFEQSPMSSPALSEENNHQYKHQRNDKFCWITLTEPKSNINKKQH